MFEVTRSSGELVGGGFRRPRVWHGPIPAMASVGQIGGSPRAFRQAASSVATVAGER